MSRLKNLVVGLASDSLKDLFFENKMLNNDSNSVGRQIKSAHWSMPELKAKSVQFEKTSS
jgi:hypothetical protein